MKWFYEAALGGMDLLFLAQLGAGAKRFWVRRDYVSLRRTLGEAAVMRLGVSGLDLLFLAPLLGAGVSDEVAADVDREAQDAQRLR